MRYPNLRGKSCILVERCSTDAQVETSIPDQDKFLRTFAAEHQMKVVGVVALEGMTGSLPGKRSDVNEIIDRKQKKNDFEVLLFHDSSRFTRSGIAHGSELKRKFQAARIDVIFVADGVAPDNKHAPLIEAFQYHIAEQHADAISYASTRGRISAIGQGRAVHSPTAAYGIDHLYVSHDGTPRCIIRLMPDGSQQQLDPKTKEVIRVFGVGGKKAHYRKQPDEVVVLIPGDEERVHAVQQIFRRKFNDGWGALRIASELNKQGLLSYDGKPWREWTIAAILKNPVYTGTGIYNKWSRGIYYSSGDESPVKSLVNKAELADRAAVPNIRRDYSEWKEQRHPALETLLEPDLRERVISWHKEILPVEGKGLSKYANKKDRHTDSPYILKEILHTKKEKFPMTGRVASSHGYRKRYYALARSYLAPGLGPSVGTMIPAPELENCVLNAVSAVFSNIEDMRERLVMAVERDQQGKTYDDSEERRLARELDRVKKQLDFIIDASPSMDRDAAKRKVCEYEARRIELEGQLEKAKAAASIVITDPRQHVDALLAKLSDMVATMEQPDVSPLAVRRLLKVLVSKLEVDTETKEVDIEISLPMSLTKGGIEELTVCLDPTLGRPHGVEANGEFVVLSRSHCTYKKRIIGSVAYLNNDANCFYCRRIEPYEHVLALVANAAVTADAA